MSGVIDRAMESQVLRLSRRRLAERRTREIEHRTLHRLEDAFLRRSVVAALIPVVVDAQCASMQSSLARRAASESRHRLGTVLRSRRANAVPERIATDPIDALYAELARVEELPASPEREAEVQRLLTILIERERKEAERMRVWHEQHRVFDADAAERALDRADELIRRHAGPAA